MTRVKGHKEDTILQWLREAAAHAEAVEEALLQDFRVKRAQLDGLWLRVGGKGGKKRGERGVFVRSTLLDIGSRLRVARAIACDETQASVQVFETLKRRGQAVPPALISDGWGGIGQAMVAVYGVVPRYGGGGRPPTRKRSGAGWRYLQVVKLRDGAGRVLGTELRAIFGDLAGLTELLGRSTAYVERSHLTSRLFNVRQVRKTIAFSKDIDCCRASAVWEDVYYNLVRVHKGLRLRVAGDCGRKWLVRTPAMVAGVTDHVWTVGELLTTVPLRC